MSIFSWAFWLGWMLVGAGYELFAVVEEKKTGALPLTRIVRDRLARRFWPAKIALVAFLAWLSLHLLVPLFT